MSKVNVANGHTPTCHFHMYAFYLVAENMSVIAEAERDVDPDRRQLRRLTRSVSGLGGHRHWGQIIVEELGVLVRME